MTLEGPRVPMILGKSEIPAERCSSRTGERPEEWCELLASHQAPQSCCLSSCLGLPPTITSLPHQSAGTTQFPWESACNAFPALTTAQHRWAQTRQIWRAREEVSVIIAQTSSVCEGGGQTIFTEALTFRNLPQCHI